MWVVMDYGYKNEKSKNCDKRILNSSENICEVQKVGIEGKSNDE